MKIKLVSLAVAVLAVFAGLSSIAVTHADSWMEYRPVDNSFAVSAPALFHVTAERMMTPMGPVTAPLFSQEEGGNAYFVSYVELPEGYLATTAGERIVESGITTVLQSHGAMLSSKSNLYGVNGKAFTGTIRAAKEGGENGVLHGRVYLERNRLFLVYVSESAVNGNNAQAVEYLNSFRILNDVASR